jgi:RNA polymerase sigma factor (sigma-70 family)
MQAIPAAFPQPSPPTVAANTSRFQALIEGHKKILYKVAWTYCRDREDRRDLVQEMLIQVWRSFERFDERVKFSTWMYRIAMNVAISHYRHEKRRMRDTLPLEEFGMDIATADALFEEQADNMRVLEKLIAGMDEMNRALILLFLDGFSHEEIADVVGISTTNVATRINRIKQRLQREFVAA